MVPALAFVIGPILVLFAYAAVRTSRRGRALRRSRAGSGFSRQNFIDSFRGDDVPELIASTVYDYFSEDERKQNFPIAPDDDIFGDLSCVGDGRDYDEAIEDLHKRLNCKILPNYVMAKRGIPEVQTLRHLVLTLDWARRNQPSGPS